MKLLARIFHLDQATLSTSVMSCPGDFLAITGFRPQEMFSASNQAYKQHRALVSSTTHCSLSRLSVQAQPQAFPNINRMSDRLQGKPHEEEPTCNFISLWHD